MKKNKKTLALCDIVPYIKIISKRQQRRQHKGNKMKNEFYSPNHAGELVLNEAIRLRKILRNHAVIKYRGDLEKRTLRIVEINKMDIKSLKNEAKRLS